MRQIPLQFVTEISETLEILTRAPHPVLGLAPALLVLGYASRLLNKNAEFLWFRFYESRHHTLLNDGVAAWPKAGAQKEVGDIPSATLCAIQVVLGLCLTGYYTADRDFVVSGEFPCNFPHRVIKNQLYGRLTDRLPAGRAIENHVGHGLATQGLGRTLAHDPPHRIDDIGFTAAIWPDNRAHIARELDGGGVNKGFEAGQFDGFQAHFTIRVENWLASCPKRPQARQKHKM